MTRKTSIDAYRKIEAEGLLSRKRFMIYKALYDHGPLTQGEAWHFYFKHDQRHSICPRFAELERVGAIESVGERECKYSGVNSMLWDVTDKLPRKLNKLKEPTKIDLIRSLCEHIRLTWTTNQGSLWYARAHELVKQCERYIK